MNGTINGRPEVAMTKPRRRHENYPSPAESISPRSQLD
jgi:hypothetical protein